MAVEDGRQRMTGLETRNKLTDYWAEHRVEQSTEFALLTNIIRKERLKQPHNIIEQHVFNRQTTLSDHRDCT